jgi:hypothetical protein
MPLAAPRRLCGVLRAGLLVAFIAAAPVCWSQEVTVRVVNGKSGKPMKGRGVDLSAQDARLYPRAGGNLGPFKEGNTGRDGTVRLSVPPPRPSSLFVGVGVPSEVIYCGSTPPSFPLEEVMKSGVISENSCDPSGKIRARFKPEPGEILIFMRKLTFREKWCREMVLFCW